MALRTRKLFYPLSQNDLVSIHTLVLVLVPVKSVIIYNSIRDYEINIIDTSVSVNLYY
jgi:hypothetical protein